MSGDQLVVSPAEEGYPTGLQDLEDPPPIYVIGALSPAPGVAVVGTRRCTRYGIDLAEAFGSVLSRSGWTTVSGLARGIDAAAHRGALAVGGHAVAVLGSGVDVCYPAENRGIYDSIVETGGAILSEYGPGTPPARWRFPARNRLIASISSAVVVVEAGRTGGALITARLAAEIGRPVFVVPGDVDREASEGCNRLIRDGAHPVLGAADLVEELSLVLGPPAPTFEQGLIPAGGLDIEELPSLWGLAMPQVLARIGSMELSGRARRVGRRVYPG